MRCLIAIYTVAAFDVVHRVAIHRGTPAGPLTLLIDSLLYLIIKFHFTEPGGRYEDE